MVQKLPFEFDLFKIRAYFDTVKDLGTKTQVNLTYRVQQKPYLDGCGSAYSGPNYENQLFAEQDFKTLVGEESNPIFDIITNVRSVAKSQFNLNIGRIRFMTQEPKTCLSYHWDAEHLRLHIPIYTNPRCFFVVNDQVYRMACEGHLYTLKTNVLHTPINANMNFWRTHLVFSTYE